MQELEQKIRRLEMAFPAFCEDIRLACEYTEPDPASSLTKSRMVTEKLLIEIYKREMGHEPRKPLLGEILADNQFTRKLERRLISRINSIRDMGNLGPHGETVEPTDALRVLDDLCMILDWYLQRYAQPGSSSAVDHQSRSQFERNVPNRRQKRISVNAFVKTVGCSLTVVLTLLVAVGIPMWLGVGRTGARKNDASKRMPPTPVRPPDHIDAPTVASVTGHMASPFGTGWVSAAITAIEIQEQAAEKRAVIRKMQEQRADPKSPSDGGGG